MFRVLLSKSVSDKITEDQAVVHAKFALRYPYSTLIDNKSVATLDAYDALWFWLEQNPYGYPKISRDVYCVRGYMLQHVYFYYILADTVIVFHCETWEDAYISLLSTPKA